MVKKQVFNDCAYTNSKIVELFKNLNYPIPETRANIEELNKLIFNKEVITMNDIKNGKDDYVSTNPYLRHPEYDHVKVVIYYDSFVVADNDGFIIPPLCVDILVPESLWSVKNVPRAILIMQRVYNLLHLAEVGSVGKLEFQKAMPLVVQDMVGYSMVFETGQYE